jgi:hypothetical protein
MNDECVSAVRFTRWMGIPIAIIFFFSPMTALHAATLVIQGGSVFDSIGGVMVPNQTVAMDGQNIIYKGAPGGYNIPTGATVINASGKYIIPGLIDGHMHSHFLSIACGVSDTDLLPLYLAAGVTTLRSAGDHIDAQVTDAQYCAAHPTTCPRLILCSDLLDMNPPIHCNEIGIGISSPSEVPAIIADQVSYGTKTVKIYAGTNRAVGSTIISEAHKYGQFVTGHLAYYSAQDAVADGIDGLEHITSVFDFSLNGQGRDTVNLNNSQAVALINQIVSHHVMVAPTLTVEKNYLVLADQYANTADNATVPQAMRDYWDGLIASNGNQGGDLAYRLAEYEKYKELTLKLYQAGVKILAGTDAPEPNCPPGLSLLQELNLLVEAGLPPSAALQAATINNAQALKMTSYLGSIDVGKLGDMVILNADPTVNIDSTRQIACVIKDGQVVPEPSVIFLMIVGLLAMSAYAWNRK